MKTKITCLLFLFVLAITSQAQTITIDPIYNLETYDGIDLTDNGVDLKKEVVVTNISDETINLIWTRVVDEVCPAEWETLVCDNNSCYAPFVSTNVTENGLNKPFVLEPGESFDVFALHTLPRMVPGCCNVKIEFTTVEEPDVLIETLIFDVGVNSPDCNFSTSTQEIAEAQLIAVFPNPTTDAFTLSNNDVVNQVDLYNTLGQKLKSFDFQNGEYLDISEFNAGIYSLVLKNLKGEALHTLMINKI